MCSCMGQTWCRLLLPNLSTPLQLTMKPSVIAILLIVIGALMLAYQGFTYTTREKAIDLGPIQVTAEKQHFVYLPPVIGGVLLVGGILMLISSKRK